MFAQLSKKYLSLNPLESATNTDAKKTKASGDSFPPMSSVGPKPFTQTTTGSGADAKAQDNSKPFGGFEQKKSGDDQKDVQSEKKGEAMGFSGMFSSLPAASPKPVGGNVSVTSNASTGDSDSPEKDYHKILTEFYQKHNPSMVSRKTSKNTGIPSHFVSSIVL